MRDWRAAKWRQARREIMLLRPLQRAGLLRYWNRGNLPGDPTYLLDLIHQCRAKSECFWHRIARLRRLALIGQGKLPRPKIWAV